MVISVTKYLTQLCQLTQKGAVDSHGDVVSTIITTINCYLYSEEATRVAGSSDAFTHVAIQKLLVPSTLTVNESDLIVNVTDKFGNLLLPQGVVTEKQHYNHYLYGPVFTELTIGVN